jgi:hypothetical protein
MYLYRVDQFDAARITEDLRLLSAFMDLLQLQRDLYSPAWDKFIPLGVRVYGDKVGLIGGSSLEDKAEFIKKSNLTQRAWGDELVRIAKKIDSKNRPEASFHLNIMCRIEEILYPGTRHPGDCIKLILEKYGRSVDKKD